ncbi:TfoX/Sxy family protein [Antribacter gilvus]|uniref:TfoX/Sxy family protein n=1 Tax=Antribacter gilvus TaxID=2304675 RepID=UPI001F0CDA1F|nr:TfoX/Sxy family protein [Antribacter gilvus]
MTPEEREATRLGAEALDRALVALGRRPAAENPDFRAGEPLAGIFPTLLLEKPGVAPLTLVLAPYLDVWVGPFSEVVLIVIEESSPGEVQGLLEKVLRSAVTCRKGRWATTVTLQIPGEEPWIRLKDLGTRGKASLEGDFLPYVDGARRVGVMAYDDDVAAQIRDQLAGVPEVTERKMFGALAFLVAGNMAVAASGQGGILVRVGDEADELIETTPATRPEMGTRTMKGWVHVDTGDLGPGDLSSWVDRGVAYARSLPPK